jgi:hypothetical protein
MEVYVKAVKRRERLSGAYLEAFDHACDWARMGTTSHQGAMTPFPGRGSHAARNGLNSGLASRPGG